ncbi:K02A2.6-like [Cordylochernes scorpioides]|uniref:K02A2.6-like n=1 Tax=Cordylochernes scorpioides TaxID=51811 RepID=A0ABY6K2T3_9ARAC|nr:K02A2.6-like [Cordylochernes scorpioides]
MEDEILNKNFDDDSETENYSLNESSDVSTDEECDSILTTVQTSSSNCFIGKNGYKWNKNHAIIGRTRSHNIITHLPGLKGPAKPKPNCGIDIFNLFFTAAIIKQISEFTNAKIEEFRQRISDLTKCTYSNFTSEIEIRAFLDITALNSYIIFNYQIDKKDQKERSTFIVDLGRSLIDEHLVTRNLNSLPLELQTTIKKFKNNDGSSTSRGSTMPQESDTPKRVHQKVVVSCPWSRSDRSVHPDHNTGQLRCLVRMDVLFWIDVCHIEGCKDDRVYMVRIVDTKDGFWNVKLSDESSNLTTFWTPFGRYKFLRMPFGLKTASEEYQRRLYEIFQGLEGIEIIADDILILGKVDSYEEALMDHGRNLENLFKAARQANLKFNINKVKLRLKEVKYLGHNNSTRIKARSRKS